MSGASYLMRDWWGAGIDCPARLWMPCPWIYLRPSWMGPWAIWCPNARTRGKGHKPESKRLYCVGDWAMAHVLQIVCGVFLLGHTQNLSTHGHGQTLHVPAWPVFWPNGLAGPFQSHLHKFSMILWLYDSMFVTLNALNRHFLLSTSFTKDVF